jgi:hypothetical protein
MTPIFAWEQRNGVQHAARQIHGVDAHGFITQYWKELLE